MCAHKQLVFASVRTGRFGVFSALILPSQTQPVFGWIRTNWASRHLGFWSCFLTDNLVFVYRCRAPERPTRVVERLFFVAIMCWGLFRHVFYLLWWLYLGLLKAFWVHPSVHGPERLQKRCLALFFVVAAMLLLPGYFLCCAWLKLGYVLLMLLSRSARLGYFVIWDLMLRSMVFVALLLAVVTFVIFLFRSALLWVCGCVRICVLRGH